MATVETLMKLKDQVVALATPYLPYLQGPFLPIGEGATWAAAGGSPLMGVVDMFVGASFCTRTETPSDPDTALFSAPRRLQPWRA